MFTVQKRSLGGRRGREEGTIARRAGSRIFPAEVKNKFPARHKRLLASALGMLDQRLFDFSHVRLFDNRCPGEAAGAPQLRLGNLSSTLGSFLINFGKWHRETTLLCWDRSLMLQVDVQQQLLS